MAHTYSHLYGLPATGLAFYVWARGRPDMALFLFTRAMLASNPIQVFNNGQMVRDFTYIDDIVESLMRLLDKPATAEAALIAPARIQPLLAPRKVFNIGNSNPTPLMNYIEAVEEALGITSSKNFCRCSPVMCPLPLRIHQHLRPG